MQTPSPQDQILDMGFGFMRSRLLQVFAELKMADYLAAGQPVPIPMRPRLTASSAPAPPSASSPPSPMAASD
jgi:hypothetical protein